MRQSDGSPSGQCCHLYAKEGGPITQYNTTSTDDAITIGRRRGTKRGRRLYLCIYIYIESQERVRLKGTE